MDTEWKMICKLEILKGNNTNYLLFMFELIRISRYCQWVILFSEFSSLMLAKLLS